MTLLKKPSKIHKLKLSSRYALLDVKNGRKTLEKHFHNGGENIPVTIHGHIVDCYGHDDGTSIEFEVIVEKVVMKKPKNGV